MRAVCCGWLMIAAEGLAQSSGAEEPAGRITRVSGYALYTTGQYLAAISAFEAVEPKSAAIYNQMGIAAEHMYMLPKAEDSFRRAIQMDPKDAEAYNNLATVYQGQKAYGKAEKYYKKALKLESGNAVAEKNLGTLYFARKKYRDGEMAYSRALALDKNVFATTGAVEVIGDQKNNADADFHLARMFAETGAESAALDYLQKAVAAGFSDRKRLLEDKAFAGLKGIPEFARLVGEMGG
jgi:tetratricopeptide (TPR) repeat protein